MLDFILDLIAFGLIDGIISLFEGEKRYKFFVSNKKNGTKFRIRSVYIEKKQKYKIHIEQLSGKKFLTLQKGVYDNENIIEEFQNQKNQSSGFEFFIQEYKHLKVGQIRYTLDSIGWYDTE